MVLTGAVWTIGKSLAEWPTGGYNAVKALRKENSQPTTVLVPRSSDGSAAVPAEVLRPEGNSQPFIELPAGTGSTYDEVETDSAEGEEYFGAPVTWDAVSGFYGSEYTADTLSDYADSDKMTTVRPNGAVGFGPDVNATGKTTDASSQQQESASAASFITAEDGRALATGYGASKLKIDPSTAEAPMPSNIEVAGTALLGSGIGLAKMCGRLTLFSATMPLEAMNVFAKGFRNAPALYGDDTIRPQKRITGFRSGLTEAGRVCILCVVRSRCQF